MADTATKEFVIPETVTISAAAAIEALALIDAYQTFTSRLTGRSSEEVIEDLERLLEGDGDVEGGPYEIHMAIRGGRDDDKAFNASYDAVNVRSDELVKQIGEIVGPVDGAGVARLTKQVRQLAENVIGVTWDDEREKWGNP